MQNAERRMQNFGTLRVVWKNTPITKPSPDFFIQEVYLNE